MAFTCIRTEGGLIPADILEEIAAGEAVGQRLADFGLPASARFTDEIAAAWADARAYWEAFQRGLRRIPDDDPATTITRDQWVLPLLRSLGYEALTFMPRAAVVENSTYAISHRLLPLSPSGGRGGSLPRPNAQRAGGGEGSHSPSPEAAGEGDEGGEGVPVHIAGCRVDLDRRPPAGRPRLSPHALVQEYLNRTEHLWGVVTNGYRLRLLRDSALMTRPAYVEFDLRQMLEGEHFADFALLYRLVHRSRLPAAYEDADTCWLEGYYQQALEQGGRVRERLRDGVEEALLILGTGFLRHPDSAGLRARFQEGDLTPQAYYRQLLRLVYRLLFLMVSEERSLVGPDDVQQAEVYNRYYSITRLRDLAEGYIVRDDRHADLWQGLQQTFRLYEDGSLAHRLGMEALDGDLFGSFAIPDLEKAVLYNSDLLRAIRWLSLYREKHVVRRVNYAALDVEEMGSVYESLLEYYPVVEERDGRPAFAFVRGTERKTTGSYYTRPELVRELIGSALEPVIADRLAGKTTPEEQEAALLAIKVCDPACGSGHFLLAAARRLGRELARVRTGEEHPTPAEFRRAVRDAIRCCIYGVDVNPLAVDLCKVALWLEGHSRGMPLTFLDHRIKVGDSLVGVLDLKVLAEGIPDDAYAPVGGDDRKVASGLKKQNHDERQGQLGLFEQAAPPNLDRLAELLRRLSAEPDEDIAAIRNKQQRYQAARDVGGDWWQLWTACNLWTAPFFAQFTPDSRNAVPTTSDVRGYLAQPAAAHGQRVGLANALGQELGFFHWPLEFPDVFLPQPSPPGGGGQGGGFDVVLSNPPWERIKLQELEFFAARDPDIAGAPNKAARAKLIKALPQARPALWKAYQAARHQAEASSRFLRGAERYPLTARGDINTYQVFAELLTRLVGATGRVGMIVPTGIATDYTTRDFFAALVDSRRLVSIFDFENREGLFPEVHRSYKFSLLTMRGNQQPAAPTFVFFATNPKHLDDETRRFTLTRDDIARINPNTRTCPVFRTRPDAELTRKIYARVPVLEDESTGENPWGVRFSAMFHMSNDSHLFRTREQLEGQGGKLQGNRFLVGDEMWLPLYEAKMIWHFDHRYGSYETRGEERGYRILPPTATELHGNAEYSVQPFYWVSKIEITKRLADKGKRWLLGFRDVTFATVERTAIFSLLSLVGVGHTAPLAFTEENTSRSAAFLANMNTLVCDYVARQKMGGMHLSYNLLRQLPVLLPTAYTEADLHFIVPRVLELVYTAWDLAPFADDLWREALTPSAPSPDASGEGGLRTALTRQWEANAQATGGGHAGAQPPEWLLPSPPGRGVGGEGFPHPPFKWDEERRAILRAELNAYYARLYGLTEQELRYILDPADVYGEDFPGETFRVLKEKEIRQHGEYRTRRLVLEAWERLNH